MTKDDDTSCLTISIEEAARQLGVCKNTAYRAAERGEIPSIRIGKLLRVPIAAMERKLACAE